MAVVTEVIRLESDHTISFGNYSVIDKQKVNDFEVDGDIYKVKTHKDITRLEKNGKLLFESVPGTAVHNFKIKEKATSFNVEGFEDTQITLEQEPEKEYRIIIDDVNVGSTTPNFSGKISFSIELDNKAQSVKIEKF